MSSVSLGTLKKVAGIIRGVVPMKTELVDIKERPTPTRLGGIKTVTAADLDRLGESFRKATAGGIPRLIDDEVKMIMKAEGLDDYNAAFDILRERKPAMVKRYATPIGTPEYQRKGEMETLGRNIKTLMLAAGVTFDDAYKHLRDNDLLGEVMSTPLTEKEVKAMAKSITENLSDTEKEYIEEVGP